MAAERAVTVVVPAWNASRWLPGCLDALRAQTYKDFSVVVVDSGSTDGCGDGLVDESLDLEVVRLAENRGFAPAVNAGVRAARSPYVALLNVDTRARPRWLEALVGCLEELGPEVAGVSSKMLDMEHPGLIDDAGDSLSWYGSATKQGHGEPAETQTERREIFSVSGGAALYRRSFLAQVGFDPRYHSYFEDIDVGLRGRIRGYRFFFEPRAEVLHHGGGAGLGRGRYVTLVTRNRLMTFLKSIPGRLLFKHWHRLAWGQLYFFIAYKRPLHSLLGYLSLARNLPHILEERRRLSRERVLSDAALDRLLGRELGEPPLRELLLRRLRGRPGGAVGPP